MLEVERYGMSTVSPSLLKIVRFVLIATLTKCWIANIPDRWLIWHAYATVWVMCMYFAGKGGQLNYGPYYSRFPFIFPNITNINPYASQTPRGPYARDEPTARRLFDETVRIINDKLPAKQSISVLNPKDWWQGEQQRLYCGKGGVVQQGHETSRCGTFVLSVSACHINSIPGSRSSLKPGWVSVSCDSRLKQDTSCLSCLAKIRYSSYSCNCSSSRMLHNRSVVMHRCWART